MLTLEGFCFYEMLGSESQAYLKESIKPVSAPKGSILFFQGDTCEEILLLSKGRLRLYIQGEAGDVISLYHLEEGEQCIVNTSSAISSSPAIATAETLCDIEGWLLSLESVRRLMKESESYQEYIFSLFTTQFSTLAETIEEIKFIRLEDRLIKWLKKQHTTLTQITHEELSIELGSTRVSISRALKALEKQEKVKLHRGAVELLLM